MPLADKVVSAKKIEGFLRATIVKGGFKLKYRITVDPPLPEERDWERPDILVELSGPDSDLLLERGGELLRSLEHLALEMLRLGREEHDASASIAAASVPCASRNSSSPPTLPPSASARAARPTNSAP
ncbi:MAG: hypothetical protein ACHP7I_07845 [Terriglobales bacterium]